MHVAARKLKGWLFHKAPYLVHRRFAKAHLLLSSLYVAVAGGWEGGLYPNCN
jgi:hypothetical protein